MYEAQRQKHSKRSNGDSVLQAFQKMILFFIEHSTIFSKMDVQGYELWKLLILCDFIIFYCKAAF